MHPGPATQSVKAPPPPPDNGGEGEDNMTDITTSCTEVCGLGQGGRSCSKICHPKGFRNKAYVILDDQSNRSLARPQFF